MLKSITGLPPDVVAIEASEKITHEDYRGTLIPRAEAMLANGPVKMLCVLGQDFTGFDLEALWDDSVFGAACWAGQKKECSLFLKQKPKDVYLSHANC